MKNILIFQGKINVVIMIVFFIIFSIILYQPVCSADEAADALEIIEEFDDQPHAVYDPLIKYNRLMTRFNDKLYVWILKPASKGYAAIAPEPFRLAIDRFFLNIKFPVRFVNSLFQQKWKVSGIECARFTINTTLGILGFADPASEVFKINASEEDFGQTLGRYGMGSGCHIVLPLFGPSNVRDVLGRVTDYFLTPTNYLNDTELALGVSSFERLNFISLHRKEYELIKKEAIDAYLLIRDGYEKNRNLKIRE
ncbi:MAG: VacJ family lipoprotein [Desulfobacterales bacterium]|nr:VacJ family lipoprotein [Desulfobacterales bacterium]